jgi:hypothetical protein
MMRMIGRGMKENSATISKYGRGDTQTKLTKQWKESQDDIKMAKSGVACDRLIALHRFKELFAKNKRLIALQNLEDPYY